MIALLTLILVVDRVPYEVERDDFRWREDRLLVCLGRAVMLGQLKRQARREVCRIVGTTDIDAYTRMV